MDLFLYYIFLKLEHYDSNHLSKYKEDSSHFWTSYAVRKAITEN